MASRTSLGIPKFGISLTVDSIGSSARLLCGMTVGEYTIVGAGSAVTKDVPPYGAVVDNPAKLLTMLPRKK